MCCALVHKRREKVRGVDARRNCYESELLLRVIRCVFIPTDYVEKKNLKRKQMEHNEDKTYLNESNRNSRLQLLD